MPAHRPSSPAIVFGIGALSLLGVIALFQVVLEAPSPSTPCSSSLPPGPFQAALVPAHLAAAAILWGCLHELGANRRALAAVAAFALACLIVPGIFGVVGIAALIAVQILGFLVIPALLICTLVVLRWLRDTAERRETLVSNARIALWFALTVALPANLAFAWLSGVSLFCF